MLDPGLTKARLCALRLLYTRKASHTPCKDWVGLTLRSTPGLSHTDIPLASFMPKVSLGLLPPPALGSLG